MDRTINHTKTIRRRRSECSWRKPTSPQLKYELEAIDYPPGPIDVTCSWNPINRAEKPPYSYATIIGHAILTSKERKLTLNDIYVWITENYPFYSNDTQGWQNSIRHNLSLHKSFVKIDRDPNAQNPPRKGCFWTIRPGKERFFIDNLQKPSSSIRKQQSLSSLSARRQHHIRRSSSNVYDKSSLFNTSRTTHTAEIPSTTLPESEPIVVSSSSDHLSSPSSSSLSGSPTYHQLLCNVPESSMSYNVYPEQTHELFGDQSLSYSTAGSYLTDSNSSHPPSLSPCDAYSTSSSFADHHQYMNYSNGSPDRLYSLSHVENNKLYQDDTHSQFALEWPSSTLAVAAPLLFHQPKDHPYYVQRNHSFDATSHFSAFHR